MEAGELFSGIEGFIRGVPERAADADGVIIPQIAAYFSKDHRNRIGGKFYIWVISKLSMALIRPMQPI